MLVWLVLLVAIIAIAIFILNYRRQAAAREAANAERMKAFLEQARAGKSTDAPTPTLSAAAIPAAAAPATAAASARPIKPAPDVAGFSARHPMLNAEQAALYRLLKSALPSHEVFAQVSLAAFIAPPADLTGFAREAQLRRLADAVADFVVCDSAMKVVAAVQCGARSGKAAESAAFAAACVAGVGIRWIELSPQALPTREQLAQRVLGA